MSHGPGVVQRYILRKIEKDGYSILRDIKKYKQPSVSRAARELEKKNKVAIWYVDLETRGDFHCKYGPPERKYFHKSVIATSPGMTPDRMKVIFEELRRDPIPHKYFYDEKRKMLSLNHYLHR
jgi:hypothetical protein